MDEMLRSSPLGDMGADALHWLLESLQDMNIVALLVMWNCTFFAALSVRRFPALAALLSLGLFAFPILYANHLHKVMRTYVGTMSIVYMWKIQGLILYFHTDMLHPSKKDVFGWRRSNTIIEGNLLARIFHVMLVFDFFYLVKASPDAAKNRPYVHHMRQQLGVFPLLLAVFLYIYNRLPYYAESIPTLDDAAASGPLAETLTAYRIFSECSVDTAKLGLGLAIFIAAIHCADIIVRTILWYFGYTIQPLLNAPSVSQSISEFWVRWDTPVQCILYDAFYAPVLGLTQSKTLARLSSFVGSGLLHFYPLWIAGLRFSTVIVVFMLFIVHGLAVIIEKLLVGFGPKSLFHPFLAALLVNAVVVVSMVPPVHVLLLELREHLHGPLLS